MPPLSGRSYIVESQALLLAWLFEHLQPMSRSAIKQTLQQGRVTVNGIPTRQFDLALEPGDRIVITRESAFELQKPCPLPILFQDDFLIVIDKPFGLLTVATEKEKTRTAFVLLNDYLERSKQGRAFVVHRLDRDTSGVLLFARTAEARDHLQATWEEVSKTYYALVEGTPPESEGIIESFLTEGRDLRVRITPESEESKKAITHYRLLSRDGPFSRLEVRLGTGRKHQIRVQLASLGCPIVGDSFYGARTDPLARLGLHAWKLKIPHPISGEMISVLSPPQSLSRKGSHEPS